MCTVSFIPQHDKLFIAHNRDESSLRSRAVAPALHTINGYVLLYPKDSAAGGTWIAVNKNGQAGVLLNGAFVKHKHQPPYSRSRGLVMLDIMAADDILISYQSLPLNGIEPFTVILWNGTSLHECRWDGNDKHVKTLNAGEAYTWSSVTLYNEDILAKRTAWFKTWLQLHPQPSIEDVLHYHLTGGDGDKQNDLRMNRNDQMLTVSITAIEINQQSAVMEYKDLYDNSNAHYQLLLTKAAAIQ
ncbi:MAG: NRDE family protein [Chitinophagaceae bacterium]